MEDKAILQTELKDVKQELDLMQHQINELLSRQESLSHRKIEIEQLLQQKPKNVALLPDWNRNDFPWSDCVNIALTNIFKLNSFRPLQKQTINITMSGKDCILIMPTGGGKSLCFQLPAVVSDGLTIVISPLVSLMEDQLLALRNLGIEAALLNASSSRAEVKMVHDAMTNKSSNLKLLYVTPEKLKQSKRFMTKVEKMYEMGRMARIAIDEVHCCSQWGHDFRPDYKFLGILKRQFPGVPIIGLTATATVKVLEDVKNILNIPQCFTFQDSFNRPNLYYEVCQKPPTRKEFIERIRKLLTARFSAQSGIIYCLSQKDCEDVTGDLQGCGIKAGCYHANMVASQRSSVHRRWTEGQIHVVVATIAFGMGIDKPDVKFVIHHSVSKSMENYYQESGRAGRDFQNAYCMLYFRLTDVFRLSTMVFADQGGLEKLYNMLKYCLDTTKCRRTIIAQHFGERWDSSKCNKMCDHCSDDRKDVVKKDVTRHCAEVLNILDKANAVDTRLTALKLVDAWLGKGPGHLKTTVKTSMSREQCEIVLGHMILSDYLREDFHFTPYNTISYLLPGTAAKMLKISGKQVSIDFPLTMNTSSSVNKRPTTEKPSAVSAATVMNKLKPKLSIVNPEKSRVISNPIMIIEAEDPIYQSESDTPEVRKSARLSRSLKIANNIVEALSNSNDEELDFSETEEVNASIKVHRQHRWAENVNNNSKKRPSSSNSNSNINNANLCDITLSPTKAGPRKKQKISSKVNKSNVKLEDVEGEDDAVLLSHRRKINYIVLDGDNDEEVKDQNDVSLGKQVDHYSMKDDSGYGTRVDSKAPTLEPKMLVQNILRNRPKVEPSSTSSSSESISLHDETETSTGFKLRSWFSDENVAKEGIKTLKEALIESGFDLEKISEDPDGNAVMRVKETDNLRKNKNSCDANQKADGDENENDNFMETASYVDIQPGGIVAFKTRLLKNYDNEQGTLQENAKKTDLQSKIRNIAKVKLGCSLNLDTNMSDNKEEKNRDEIGDESVEIIDDDVENDLELSHSSSSSHGDESSDIFQVYAKQLSTLDIRNGSSDEESSYINKNRVRPAESMETIDEASSVFHGSVESLGSIEQSVENLRRISYLTDSDFTADSEAEFEQLQNMYHKQLEELTD